MWIRTLFAPTVCNDCIPDRGSRPGVVANVADQFSPCQNFQMSDTITVAFSNQKGGVGKSTLTVLVASYLYYELGVKVAIMDCDSPQHSLKGERDRELKDLDRLPHIQALADQQLAKSGLQPYVVFDCLLENTVQTMRKYINGDNDVQILFLDLPGTMNNYNVLQAVSNCDYVFCPMAASKYDIESTLGYCQFIHDHIMMAGYGNLKKMQILWNRIDARERKDIYSEYDAFMESIGLEAMRTTIPASVRFKRGLSANPKSKVFRSTLFPPDPSLVKGSGIDELAKEILALTGISHG